MVLELAIRDLEYLFGASLRLACSRVKLNPVERNPRMISVRMIVFFIPTSYHIEYAGYLLFLTSLASCSFG